MNDPFEAAKRRVGEQAAGLVADGQKVGLGTGSTVAAFLPALAARRLAITCVATSPATEAQAVALGLKVVPFDALERLDIALDGADQVAPDHWLVKGGGGAHTREKVVAAAAERFVVMVSANKMVDRLAAPVPVELLSFGLPSTLTRIEGISVRAGWPRSPDGGVIADWNGPLEDPAALAATLDADPGVVSHGLFPPALVADVVVA